MALNIRPSTSNERKQIFIETLMNKSNKVSKVAPNSVNAGIAAGIGRVSGKAEKDIILALSGIYPDNAYGEQLDQCAANFGIAPRFLTSNSSTYLRIVADPGTQYLKDVHTFTGNAGITFQLENDVTIDSNGFTYAKVRSIEDGLDSNIPPTEINQVTPIPIGHSYVINEYQAQGGRDIESDDLFRRRIKEGANILATGTLSMLEQVFMKINSNVLRLFYQGIDPDSKVVIAIATQNGIDLTPEELDEILDLGSEYFSLTELKPFGSQSYGIKLKNIEYQPIDISYRVDITSSFSADQIRIETQAKISKYLDFRFWQPGQKVEWTNILELTKKPKGVKYVPDQFFFPNNDVPIDSTKIPRLRGFLMLDLNGSVIASSNDNLSPVFYPQEADFSFISTVLRSIN